MDSFVAFITDWKAVFGGVGGAALIVLISWFLRWLFTRKPQESRGTELAVKALTNELVQKIGEGAEKDQEIRQLKEAVAAVSEQKGPGVAEALAELEKGETAKAEKLFEEIIKNKREEGDEAHKEAAVAARHLGALAYLNDTEKALRAYRQAVDLDPDDPSGWNQLGALLLRTGALDEAIKAFEKVLALGNRVRDKSVIAMATGNLGIIYQARGYLDEAEKHCRKALALHDELNSKEGMASVYGNLGNIYQTRGVLDKAEEYCRKALTLYDELNSKEGMANVYGNLGNIYRMRGGLDQAEEYYRKAFALNEKVGSKGGMASQLGNLGIIYQTRGDPDEAEKHYRKALAIHEEIGGKEGMAINYGNLGVIVLDRGDKEQACEYYARALALFREIGMVHEEEQAIENMKRAGCPPSE